MILEADKGVCTENPENTMPAYLAAVDQGYGMIEIYVGVTRDMQFAVLKDDTINRTARNKDGSELTEKIALQDITWAEVLKYDFGIWFSRKFKETKIPLLQDILKLAEEKGIRLQIDKKYQQFSEEQKQNFFALLRPYEEIVSLTCSRIEAVREVLSCLPKLQIHYDGPVTKETLSALSAAAAKEQLIVWMEADSADGGLTALVKEHAALGIKKISDYQELLDAEKQGADFVKTDGQIKPLRNYRVIADMHTHSENSHDSLCRIEAMRRSQEEKGTAYMAVTDHCDVYSFRAYDIYTPLENVYKTVLALNKESGHTCCLLAGAEISESFWFPEQGEKANHLLSYDVILGSVHCVRFPGFTEPYARIDFSSMSGKEIKSYLETYFDDVMALLESADIDILAHLTCPLRYISGKYGRKADLTAFREKIETIFTYIIRHGIALEVNTSSYEQLGDFMPGRELLMLYRRMGGYLITLGSDAHIEKNAAVNFDAAVEFLKGAGFRNIFYFKERHCCPCLL